MSKDVSCFQNFKGIGGGKSLQLKALRPYPPNNDASVKIEGGGIGLIYQ